TGALLLAPNDDDRAIVHGKQFSRNTDGRLRTGHPAGRRPRSMARRPKGAVLRVIHGERPEMIGVSEVIPDGTDSRCSRGSIENDPHPVRERERTVGECARRWLETAAVSPRRRGIAPGIPVGGKEGKLLEAPLPAVRLRS